VCVKPSEVVTHEKAAGNSGTVASAAAKFGQDAIGSGITELNSVKTTITGQEKARRPTAHISVILTPQMLLNDL
jgi:hypothetical protein